MGATNNPDGGFSNAIANSVFMTLPFDDKSRYFRFEEDFTKFNAVATTGAADWVNNQTQTTGTAAQTVVDEAGGILTLTPGTTSGDLNSFQWKGWNLTTDVAEIFGAPDLTQEFWFKTRFRLVDATNTAFFVGLVQTNTTPFTAFVNGVYFTKPAATTQISFGLSKASANTLLSLGTGGVVANNTFVNCGFHYSPTGVNGNPGYRLFVNDTLIASQAVLTNVPIVTLAPSFGTKAGAASGGVASIDYIYAVTPRPRP